MVVEVGLERREWSVSRVCWMVDSDMVDLRCLFVVRDEEESAVVLGLVVIGPVAMAMAVAVAVSVADMILL